MFEFCKLRKVGPDVSTQTDSRYIDESDYMDAIHRANSSEQRREELRSQLESLQNQFLARGKIAAKLQTELDTCRLERDKYKEETEKLSKELRSLQSEYRIESLEKDRLLVANKGFRKEIKSLSSLNTQLKLDLDSHKTQFELLEAAHEEVYTEAKQAKQELRVVYRQYFQPKLLSNISKEHQDGRRRSITGQSPGRNIEIQEKEGDMVPWKPIRFYGKKEDFALKINTKNEDLMRKMNVKMGNLEEGNEEITGKGEMKEGKNRWKIGEKGRVRMRKRSDSVKCLKRTMEETMGFGKEEEKESSREKAGEREIEEEEILDPPAEVPVLSPSPPLSSSSSDSDLPPSSTSIPPSNRQSHLYPLSPEYQELSIDEIRRSQYLIEETQERNRRKSSMNSEITRGKETVLRKEVMNSVQIDKDASDSAKESEATEALRDMPIAEIPENYHILPISPRNIPPENRRKLTPKLSLRDKISIGVVTDPVSLSLRPTVSIGVQFNWEQPHVIYEEDGSFRGTDGVKYYMWPVNPNMLYGLSGDVFYHTVQQIFSASPKIPLNKSGVPHEPNYLLSGTHLDPPSPLEPNQPRRPHDPQICGRNCHHHRPTRRKEGQLLPLAKQNLHY